MALKSAAVLALACLSLAAHYVEASEVGFRTEGTRILDSTGKPFVMRGINYPHAWYEGDLERAIPAMVATGTNVIRFVLANGYKWTKTEEHSVKRILDLCKEHKVVAILEAHDATGNDDREPLKSIVDYWISIKNLLIGREKEVILNIANEWMGSSGKCNDWANAYVEEVPRLRAAGLKHLIIIDSPGWGQDAKCIAETGKQITKIDGNVVFSIHMYEVAAKDEATVQGHIDASLAIGAPLIIGEFADEQNGGKVDYKSIMKQCHEKEVGWLAWSWFGNNKDTANMDMSVNAVGPLTAWGRTIIDGPHGFKETSKQPQIW